MAVLVNLVRLSFTELVTGVIVTLSGPLHTVNTVTGTSTAELNSTVQVRVTTDPIFICPWGVTLTARGAGTEGRLLYQSSLYDITRV